MKANPRGDWLIADVQRLCDQLGMELKKPSNGSHYKVVGRDGKPLVIPANKPIKPVYIKALVGWAMEHCREADEEETP